MKLTMVAMFLLATAFPCLGSDSDAQKDAAPKAVAGYKITEITPGSIYDKMGLKNGDVLLELDGQPATTPEVANKFFSALKTSDIVVLKIKRSGKIQNLKYTLK